MPINWSALRVSEAMNQVDALLDQTLPFLKQAEEVVVRAETIPGLPGYMLQWLAGLKTDLRWGIDRARGDAKRVRAALPEGAVERERSRPKLAIENNPK